MPYFVSRQHYWHSGDLVVEIAGGGTDYANPDMLVEKYPGLGEGKEYDDPREAVAAAIKIRDAWNADTLADRESGHVIEPDPPQMARIEAGFTGGYTMPFEEHPTDEQLNDWAQKAWNNIPKCPGCGEVMHSDQRWGHDLLYGEYIFCSENCADNDYNRTMRDMVVVEA
jgi:hypothetical protein